MTLTKRLIPCLDVKGGRVVKGINFINLQDIGDPIEFGNRYSECGADELVFLDISASSEARQPLYNMVRDIAEKLTIPFTVGGGIRTIHEVRKILSNGADKVAVNTGAVENPQIVSLLSRTFGSQCIVAAIDCRRTKYIKGVESETPFEVFTYGGRKNTGIEAVRWALEVELLGAGEILLTSMDRDGTRIGYDIELTKLIAESVSIPVIASGGAGEPRTFLEVFTKGKADAALAASSFHYDQYPIQEVKEYLRKNGVAVRP
ncbi:imidazole glycerol phosphate synthase subunit HisF [Candidatus Thorarchaeota archaeon]|nr:MAG: imidazole glycerol phosphate synthase subunit HisF [Candidatus Thorarchaeota archaeon]